MNQAPLSAFLRGELTLHLRGENVHACISEFQQQRILLRSVRVRRMQTECTILLSDFDAVYRICRRNGVKFRVHDRLGLPFLRKKWMRRKTFLLGSLLFVCIIYALSSTVWRIDVIGPKDNEGQMEIRDAAKASHLYVGQRASKISDLAAIQRSILSKSPGFVWVGVRRTGSVVRIQAIPKVEGVQNQQETPQNIVADRPGVVQTVTATRGRAVVKANTYVKPGQVLISGTLSEGESNVPAQGKVMAEVWYQSQVTVPLHVSHSGLTGESITKDYVQLGKVRLRVWGFKEPHFTDVYEQRDITDWHLGSYVLPLQFSKVRMYQATTSATQKSVEDAKKTALNLAASDVSGQVGTDGSVLGQSVLHQRVAHGTLYETVLTRVLQNVGVPVAIPVKTEQNKAPAGPHSSGN